MMMMMRLAMMLAMMMMMKMMMMALPKLALVPWSTISLPLYAAFQATPPNIKMMMMMMIYV